MSFRRLLQICLYGKYIFKMSYVPILDFRVVWIINKYYFIKIY